MTLEDFKNNVIKWSTDRGIYAHSTVEAQTLKAVSEMGELADAVIKRNHTDTADALGDVIVCLVNVAHMSGLDIEDCCEQAWDAIKYRQGRMMPGGAFVKEGDQ